MRTLSEEEYLATMQGLEPVDPSGGAPFDFWPYVDELPPVVEGYRVERAVVAASYAAPTGRWQHVLLATDTPNVFVVLVLDCDDAQVAGHRLLDLNAAYGIDIV